MSGDDVINDHLSDALQQPAYGLPEGCPVIPLGHCDGIYWFSDPVGQLRKKRQLREHDQIDLFLGQTAWLVQHYEAGKRNAAWNVSAAAGALIAACAAAGDFDGGAVRGPGIWWESDEHQWDADGRPGRVLVHCGDIIVPLDWPGGRLQVGRPWRAGTRIRKWVYKRAEPGQRPARVGASVREVRWLQGFIGTWSWHGGVDDVVAMLGLIGLGRIPALMQHRPHGAVEGDTGCGKSSLFTMIQRMHGDTAIRMENSSEAFLRDRLASDRGARFVILNEFEATPGGGRAEGMVEWLRHNYTRGEGGWGRGGSNAAKGDPPDVAVMIGAIDLPAAKEEDANRRIPLRLGKLQPTERRLAVYYRREARAAALGPALWRRLLEQLPRFRATYRAYQAPLLKGGLAPRDISTWCTVLALADILAHDPLPDARAEQAALARRIEPWTRKLLARTMAAETPARAPQAVLDRILSYRIEEYRGSSKHTVLEYVLKAAEARAPEADLDVLKRIGITLTDLRVRIPGTGQAVPVRYLAVSTSMSGVEDIFRGTRFSDGLWKKQLLRIEGARAPDNPVRFGAEVDVDGRRREYRSRSAILVPLRSIGLIAVSRDPDGRLREDAVTGEMPPVDETRVFDLEDA